METERGAVLSELAGKVDDRRFSGIQDLEKDIYVGTPLEHAAGGTREDLDNLTLAKVVDFSQRHYLPQRSVLVSAGGHSHDDVVALCEAFFSGSSRNHPERRNLKVGDGAWPLAERMTIESRPITQTHVFAGLPGAALCGQNGPVISIVNSLLGSGNSSLLWRLNRERGIGYDAISFFTAYSDRGHIGLYISTRPSLEEKALDVLRGLAREVQRSFRPEDATASAVALVGRYQLGLETTVARCRRLVESELRTSRLVGLEARERSLREAVPRVGAMLERLAETPLVVRVIRGASRSS